MKHKVKVTVIMGGVSSEHKVSLMSGNEIIKNLDKSKYKTTSLIIDRKGRGIEKIAKTKPDVVLIALHGKGGEDGTIQGYLESLGIRHTGSGVATSAIGMDKIVFRGLMKINKIKTPEFVVWEKGEKDVIPNFNPPYFVKPYNGGSSVGVSFVRNKKSLKNALSLALKYSDKAIIEKYIKGLEVSCGVLGNDNPKALPVVEIHPLLGGFFDYESKYKKGGSKEIAPAKISSGVTKRVEDLSVKIYKIVGCSGYARVDYILENGKEPIVLEINTLPGMTPNSLLPKEAKASGISYSKLLDMIIRLSIVK